ncbi:MAG: hypothetical protein P4L87_25250 [Formivibrio sp.]|nr:hypothetical protein [Formivibrio sp.]
MKFPIVIRRDFSRLFYPLLICIVFFAIAAWLPRWLGIPELAPGMMWVSLAFVALSFAHIGRRVLFKVDLHVLIDEARKSPAGAGLCVLGICIVLAVLIPTFALLFSR